jgi:hypothetical protein
MRRVVRDLCRQRGVQCVLCKPYGIHIEFQLTAKYRPITLKLDGNRIRATISQAEKGCKQLTIRIVRIRGSGSGYVLRKKIRTATFVLIELIGEARQSKRKERTPGKTNEHSTRRATSNMSVVQR